MESAPQTMFTIPRVAPTIATLSHGGSILCAMAGNTTTPVPIIPATTVWTFQSCPERRRKESIALLGSSDTSPMQLLSLIPLRSPQQRHRRLHQSRRLRWLGLEATRPLPLHHSSWR